MIAQECNLQLGEFIWTGGDTHLYLNHLEQVELQLARDFRALPSLSLNPTITSVFDFQFNDIQINNYDSHPAIKAPVAV